MNAAGWRRDFSDSPFFAGLTRQVSHFVDYRDWPELADLNRHAEHLGIVNGQALPIRFDRQDRKCSQRQYEDGIYATGRVPTRTQSWHDFFNALIWLAWPHAKGALNSTQQRALNAPGSGRRGPLSDAATLFDESGLVLLAPDDTLESLLRARQWRAAFHDARALWQTARLYVFGHSLLEKSLQRTPGITGKCLFLKADTRYLSRDAIPEWLDMRVASAWDSGEIQRPEVLMPIPVMGVPGFDPANSAPGFYDNTQVFRPMRITP